MMHFENSDTRESQFSEFDHFCMSRALNAALEAKGTTFPNPAVGAVIAKNGHIIAVGATGPYGTLHAEPRAIADASENTRDSTLYVTLEPCNHTGKTPPCTDAIIAAGISRVVVATPDENPLVCGKGIEKLRTHGIRVDEGLLQNEAQKLNEDFFYSIREKKAWVSVKTAMSADGYIADAFQQSQWITSESARKYVHELRRMHAAVLIGAETLRRDRPMLSVRHKEGYAPARIVLTHDLSHVSEFLTHWNPKENRSIVAVAKDNPVCAETLPNGMEIWYIGSKNVKDSFEFLLQYAYSQHISSIFIEGGSTIVSQFVEEKMTQRLYLFYGNKILGGGLPAFQMKHPLALPESLELDGMNLMPFDRSWLVTAKPVWR